MRTRTHAPVIAPADVCYQPADTCCSASLLCLAHSLSPVSLTGAVAELGGKGEAFVCYTGGLISFLTAGRITSEVIACNADLPLLEMAFFFFLCLLRGFSMPACSKAFGCLWFLAERTLVEQIWGSKQSFVLLSPEQCSHGPLHIPCADTGAFSPGQQPSPWIITYDLAFLPRGLLEPGTCLGLFPRRHRYPSVPGLGFHCVGMGLCFTSVFFITFPLSPTSRFSKGPVCLDAGNKRLFSP